MSAEMFLIYGLMTLVAAGSFVFAVCMTAFEIWTGCRYGSNNGTSRRNSDVSVFFN